MNLFVSNECFFYCRGCYSRSRYEKRGDYISANEIISFLTFAYSKGVRKITLCGGDPLTRPDIISLLEAIKSIGLKISLDTVGTTLMKDVKIANKTFKKLDAEQVSKLVDVIGIPIDGSTDEICQKFRNSSKFSLKEQIKICEMLYKNDTKVCVNTVVHKQNLSDAVALSEMVKNINFINEWQVFQFSPQSKNCREQFEITNKEFETFKNNVITNFDSTSTKLVFKSCSDRNSLYMMIDNEGDAWTPSFSDNLKNSHHRKVIGNIKNKADWNVICNEVLNK